MQAQLPGDGLPLGRRDVLVPREPRLQLAGLLRREPHLTAAPPRASRARRRHHTCRSGHRHQPRVTLQVFLLQYAVASGGSRALLI